jgi:hypothetical protein
VVNRIFNTQADDERNIRQEFRQSITTPKPNHSRLQVTGEYISDRMKSVDPEVLVRGVLKELVYQRETNAGLTSDEYDEVLKVCLTKLGINLNIQALENEVREEIAAINQQPTSGVPRVSHPSPQYQTVPQPIPAAAAPQPTHQNYQHSPVFGSEFSEAPTVIQHEPALPIHSPMVHSNNSLAPTEVPAQPRTGSQIVPDLNNLDWGNERAVEVFGKSLQWIFAQMGFSSAKFLGIDTRHPRIVTFRMRMEQLMDFVRFDTLQTSNMQYALNFVGVTDVAFVPGLGGHFQMQVPKPKRFWGSCSVINLAEKNDRGQILCSDATTIPRIPIGISTNGEKQFVTLKQPMLYCGMTRSGKSNLSRVLTLMFCLTRWSSLSCLGAIDLRKKTLGGLKGIPHLWNGEVITDVDRAIAYFRSIIEESKRRDQIFTDAGVDKYTEYNRLMLQQNREPLPFWFTVLEEVATLKDDQSKATRDEIDYLLDKLVRETNGNGFGYAIGDHTPTQETVTTKVRNNCPTRIVLQSTEDASVYITGMKGRRGQIGELLLGEGDAWCLYKGEEPMRMQIAEVTDSVWEGSLDKIRQVYANCRPVVTFKESSLNGNSSTDDYMASFLQSVGVS